MTDIATAPGGALIVDTRLGTGAVNDVSLVTYAWYFNVLPLWFDSPDPKGDGPRDVPDLDGSIAQPLRPGPTTYVLKGVVSGFVDPDTGEPNDDPYEGVERYSEFLRANVCDPKPTGDGTWPAVITKPSGRMLAGYITPQGLKSVDGGVGPIVAAQFTLQVASGILPAAAVSALASRIALGAPDGTVTAEP